MILRCPFYIFYIQLHAKWSFRVISWKTYGRRNIISYKQQGPENKDMNRILPINIPDKKIVVFPGAYDLTDLLLLPAA